MPFSIETNKNQNNIDFIEKFFDTSEYGPAAESYPDFNYRVRMAELTDFWPYYSEAKKVPSETPAEYDARVNTSGRLFRNQFIVLNDIIHKDMDVSGMIIGQDYEGHVPEVMFYIEKCELLEGGKEYKVHPKNLNDANFLINGPPQVSFSVHPDLSLKKGYYCYRKTSAVQKNNNKLVAVQSGWEKVAEFSNNDVETYLANVNLDDKKRNVGFSFIDSGVSGYSGWTNELMTSYKVLDSGAVSAKESDRNVNYLRKSRTINHISDPYKSYTLERKVSRISNSAENPPSWDLISPQAQFPYTDTEYLGDSVTGAIDFRVNGVYEVIEPMGYYLESDLDYFQVDLVEDWGKSELRDYTFRQDTKELNFEGGESVKLVQKSVSRDNTGPLGGSHDILGVVEASFSPNSIGVSGSITGSGNASNFYQLEYQLVPKEEKPKKLYYQKVSDVNDTISVGDRVFFNSGSNKDDNDDDVYTPIETNVFGDSVKQLDSISPIAIEAASKDQEEYIGPSIISGVFRTMEPQEVSSYESSGVGYSTFSSGEKYLVVPKGGYNTLDSDRTLLSYSAGETRSTFYQGDQKWPNTDEDLQYALTEYRTFDPINDTEEPYCFNKEREIRISDQALCLGDSATEIPDRKLPDKVYLLDYEYGSDQVLRNASILNIDHLDGSIKKSNLSSSKGEFERKPNLFFEKSYIGAVTILATGQKQEEDVSMLKEIMSTEMSEGASVFYLERDIYIDSDVSTQANSRAPSVFSSSSAGPAEAFALNENTRNPQSRGEEKLYLTETYHTDFDNYPFNDSSYYTKRPNIIEEFKYSDHKDSQDKLFRLTNVENESTYVENDFGCIVNYERDDPYSIDGYNLLSYLGVSLTATASSSDPLTTGNYDPIKNTVDIQGFVPSNTGVYYEFQVRDRAQSYNWETMLHAKEIHAGNIDDFPVGHSLLAETHANVDVRALEWNKSNIITNINAIKVANESPDSLILKSDGVKFYDESKFEHSITNTPSPNDISISSITESSGTATATTSTAHSLTTGDAVTISGATPTAYNNSFLVVVTGATTFTFGIEDGTGDASGTIIGNVLVTVVTDNPNSFSSDVDVMNLDGSADKFLSLASHRSFDIQNGNFSMEFWIKPDSSHSGIGYVAQRGKAFQVLYSSNKIQFKVNGDDHLESTALSTSDWSHVAIVARINRISRDLDLSLFINGVSKSSKKVSYGDLSGQNGSALIVGEGLTAKLYGLRIYIGKSNYTEEFKDDVPTAPFEREANPRSYKILKYTSSREASSCNWVINKNTFNNVSPPSQYREASDEAETFHMSEWVAASSTTEELSSSYNRAVINYINGYAYSAPNNPHINKNYEGTPIEKHSDPSKPSVSKQLDSIVFDNYEYIDRLEGEKQSLPAPYLYEYTKGNDLDLVRFHKKGGYDMELQDRFQDRTFDEGSRLRITKYVYKVYTKRAVVVGDVGYKNSRGHQSGWDYQLQYSTDSGSIWKDLASDAVSQAENIFYNNEYSIDSSPDGFSNISSFSSLPMVLLKTDITKKYKPEEIEFRIIKKQILTLGASGGTGKVLKKLNFLPLEVDIPSANCLLDMTQQDEYSKVIDNISISSITQEDRAAGSMGVATATTSTAHSLTTGDTVTISGATPTAYNNSFSIIVTGATTFIFYIENGTGTASGTIIGNALNCVTPRVEVKLDSDRAYILIKDENETILKSCNPNDKLQIKALSFSTTHPTRKIGPDDTDEAGFVNSTFTDLPDGRPIEIRGLTGLHITRSSLASLGDIETVIGPKPSGLVLDRVEKSYIGKSDDSYIYTAESFGLPFDKTKAFITPSIIGSHFEELDDFNKFADQPVDPVEASLINFSCKSYATGDAGDSIATGVSGVQFSPLDKFYNSPVITSDITVGEEDAGKTFITSGDVTLTKNDSTNIEVANIHGTLGGASAITSSTPIPTAEVVNSDDVVIIQDSGRVNMAGDEASNSTNIVNIFSGDNSNVKFDLRGNSTNTLAVNKDVVFVEHGKINLTKDDVGETIVIDSSVDIILPSGFDDAEDITFLNATKYEAKVDAGTSKVDDVTSQQKIGSKKTNTDYIPKETARKYTYSGGNWSASDMDIIKLNQLNLTDSDFSSTGNTIVHNEDVDIRITDKVDGDETIIVSTDDKYVNIVRNQVNNFDIENDLTDWSTPIIRVYVDEVLNHVAPSGSLGIRISKTSGGWEFKKIKPIVFNEVVVTPESAGKIYSYSGNEDFLSMRFVGFNNFVANFKIFLISNKEFLTDTTLDVYSDKEELKFLDKNGDETGYFFKARMDRNTVFSISWIDALSFLVKEEDQSNVYKFNQPDDAATRVKINRNDNFSLELPSINAAFDYDRGFDLVFCNFSETSCDTLTPKGESFTQPSVVPSFKSRNYKYVNSNNFESSYDNFKTTANIKDSSSTLNDGDFVVLDGSLSDVNLKSFKSDSYIKKEHKFSYDRMYGNYGFDGEIAKYITFDPLNSRFTLTNHELVTHQKLVFNCDKLFVSDHYYSGDVSVSSITEYSGTATATTSTNHLLQTGDTVTISGATPEAYNASFEVTVTGDTTFTFYIANGTGDASGTIIASLSVYDLTGNGDGETTVTTGTVTKGQSILAYSKGVYSFFVWAGSYVRKLTIEMPPTYEGFFDTDYQIHLVEEKDRLYTYIKSRDKVYDFSGNTEGLLTEKALARRISFDFSVNPEDYISDAKKQTFFVKVIDDNIFELYKDKDLTEQIDSKASSIANPFTLLSDTFYVENINSSSLNVINLGGSQPIKNYSEGLDILPDPLGATQESTIHQHASNLYTNGDAVPSGVYLASGYNEAGSIDTLNIDALSQDTIFLTGKFHAAGDLNHDDFNDKYFINAGMDEVVVTNTNGSTDKKIAKNRVEKHIEDDDFTPQDQNTDDRDLIYYPKNELHVLDRKTLSKDDALQEYNFVFFKPDKHSDDLKVVLPNTWSNLDSSEQIGFAVVNLHNRAVTVSNFTGDQTFNLSADTVAFMTSATDYLAKEEHNLYDNIIKTKRGDQYDITIGGEVYKFELDEDSKEAKVLQDRPNVKDYWAHYYISKPGDIILDHSVHHGKKILVDGPVNFLRPYLSSNNGDDDYSGDNYNNKTSPSVPTAFYIANISKDPVTVSVDSQWSDLASNGLLHSSQFYAAELDAFVIPDDYGEYFGHMTLAADSSSSGDFSYSGSSLDQTKTYNIFGIELSLKLNVYTSRISDADAEKINQVLSLEQAGGMMTATPKDEDGALIDQATVPEAFDYKISGIGASDISRLKIVNSVYENVRIESVAIKGELSGDDHVALASKIKSWFDEDQIARQNVFSSYEIKASEGKEWDTSYSQSVTPKFLAKNKALVLSLTEIIAPKNNQDMDGCSAFGFELDDDGNGENYDLPLKVSASDWGVVQSSFIKTDRKDVRVLKKDSVAISLADAALGDVGQNRSITCLSDPLDVVLPTRKSIGDKDFDFIIVNGSHSPIDIISPEGTTGILYTPSSFVASIPAGSSRKISYSKDDKKDESNNIIHAEKTFANPVEVETSVLGKALFRDDLDVFLVNSKTTDVSPFLILGSTDKDKKNELKVINNTGHALYIQATSESDGSDANGTQKIIPKDNYLWVLSDGNGLSARDESDGVAGTNVPLIGIRDGSVSISEKAYSKEVVLFNSDRVSLFDMVRTASTDTNFFSTTFVPFINDTDFKRYYPARTAGRAGGFTLRNDAESPVSESIPGLAPVKIGTDGRPEDTDIGVSCHLFEFILKDVNSKVVYPSKDYDYIFTDNADFSCTLYNGLGDDTNFYQLNSDGDLELFKASEEEGEAESYKASYSVKGKAVLGVSQDGETVSVTKGQVYFEQKLEDDLVDYKSFLYPRFYLNKDFYKDKTIVFKDPFEIIYSFTDGQDYYFGEADTVTLVNISKASCLTKTKVKIEPDFYYIEGSSPSSVIRPKYNLNPNGTLYVLRHLADVEQPIRGTLAAPVSGMNNLKVANISRGAININYFDAKWKVFSSERADFKIFAFDDVFYIDKKGRKVTNNIPPVECDENGFIYSIYTKYSEVRKQDKRDWFIRLTDLDVPHLIKDVNYFNEQEWEMERKTEKLGQINVDYNAVRFKFSNIFRTNRQEAAEGQTGFHTIEDYDDPYRFGVTLLSNRRGITKNIFFDKDVSEQFFPLYLKLPWDIPKDIVAYMLSTGHERLSRCLHFNERNGEITLDGINQNKYYLLRSEASSSYDFTHSVKENTLAGFNGKNYTGIEQDKEFKPSLIYNGIVYYNEQKITGVGGVSEYKLRFPYFSALKVSQFSDMEEEEEDVLEFQSDKLALQEAADKQAFNWNKVTKPLHENDFLSGRVESIASHHASDKHELLLGRKIKDIDGSYGEERKYTGKDEEEADDDSTYWMISNWFRFQIPLNAGFTYTKVVGENETIIIRNSIGADKKETGSFVAEKGDIAEIDVHFLIEDSPNTVEKPGFEYKISSSLKYNRISIPEDKKMMRISLDPKDSIPFVADGIISSLNEDFASPDADEYTIKALDNLKQKHKNKTNDGTWRDKVTSLKEFATKTLELDENYKIASNAITSLSSNQIYQSLKNNLGHSFVPAFGITSGRNPMVGFTFNLKRNLRSYKAIRFRLKKLTDREIVFDDFAKDEKLKDYFTNNSTEANLRYELNTSIDSIAYQDIAHPGGVATMSYGVEWADVELSGDLLKLPQFDDCDAIIFKENGTDIIAGKPYFLRLEEFDDTVPSYEYGVLKIFSNNTNYDSELKVNSSLAAGQKYKIVNYFDLAKRKGESGHRGQTPLMNKLYPEGLGYEEDPGLAKYPSLNFPIIVGSKKFFLERPYYQNADDWSEIALWTDTVWKKEGGAFKVRANLELSEIAQAFLSDGDKIPEMERFNDGSNRTFWKNEDIFGDVKNLLSRPNVQMQVVSWNDGETRKVKVNVKLTKGREYRCLYRRESDEDNQIYSITINGVTKTASFCDIFTATNEDFFIEADINQMSLETVTIGSEKEGLFTQSNKDAIFSTIYTYICLTESATFVDQTVKVNSDMNKADYLDYQIPILNNGNERDFGFSNPDDFYYTEGYDRIYTRNQRQENLTDTNKEHGLMYDGPMPADIKYIYPRCQEPNILSFDVSNDFWDGFIDRFETEDEYGSKSNRTKPVVDKDGYANINFTLQKLTGGVWGGGDINIDSITENLGTATVTTRGRDLEDHSLQTGSTVTITRATPEAYNASFEVTVTGDTTFTFSIEEGTGDASGTIVANVKGHNIGLAGDKTFRDMDLTARRRGKTAYATVACTKAKVGETYRLIVTNENVEYHKDGERHTFSNSKMRVPFEWKSTIFASDVTSVENSSRAIFEHRLNLTENHLLQKSIAFPKDGVSRFGSYNYERKHYDLGIKVPFTRLYMYRLNHSLSYVYVDKITQGGITKIEITDAGANYRLPPVVSVSAPTLGLAGERTATANAQIESGKIKHVEVLDAGSGYSDLNELKTNKFISNSWGRGATVEKEWLIQVAKFTYAFTLNGTKIVTHDGVKNIVFGSYVSGTGITPGTKVTGVNSSTEFEISDDATESGVQNLTIDLTERQMPYISFEEQFGIETAPVSLTPVYPEEYPKEHPLYVDACQEEFGVDFEESEEIADYVDSIEGSDLAKDAVSSVTNYVETLQEVVEDPNWNKFPPGYLGKTLGEVSEGDNSSIMESNEISTYGTTTEDEYVDSSQGTERPSVAGLYTADDRDALSEISITVGEDGEDCVTETFASIDPASLVAVINNHSLAEYRVVENKIANKSTPWISSFSRSQNPSMPKGFGINPGSPVSSEVFNAYARAVNNLYLLGAYVPIFAKIRKFRQYEYRYIEDMAGLTFKLDDPEKAGEEKGGYSGRDEVAAYYTTWQHESKINKINYLDPTEHKWKDAWFSAEFDGTGKNWPSIIKDEDKYNIYDDEDKKDLIAELWPNDIHAEEARKNQEEYMKKAGTARDSAYTPNHIGLPTVVNIPEELGVFCNPKAFDRDGHPTKAAGLLLPELSNRRAVAFGGKLVHSSEVYDVTDEDGRIVSSIVNIAGSDIIDSFYENEIIFGCQVTGKPFWSTFLKTTKEWTEFEIVPSPSFMEAISGEETLGNLTGIKGAVTRQTTVCHNEEYAKVEKRLYGDEKHSLCTGGTRSSSDYRFNYEGLFNLREGDPIVGPVNKDHEIVFDHSFGGQGVHVFRLEPEFTQALAVYGSNHYISLARYHSKSNFPSGPCIHTCSPSARAYFTASDEQLVFDLRSGSKSRPLNTTTRMPNLTSAYNNLVDPSTGDATVGG